MYEENSGDEDYDGEDDEDDDDLLRFRPRICYSGGDDVSIH